MFGIDFIKAISGFGSSGHSNDNPTTISDGDDPHIGTADCSITFHKKRENGTIFQETIILDPLNNKEATIIALTDAVRRTTHKNIHNKSSEYVKLSVTMRMLNVLYEGSMMQECGNRDNRIHIEISSTADDLRGTPVCGSDSTIDVVKSEICKNIETILAITVAGYDVSGKDGIHLAALNKASVQHKIREHRRLHNNTGSTYSKTDIDRAKEELINTIKIRISHYLQAMAKSKNVNKISVH